MIIFPEYPKIIAAVSEKDMGSCRLWPDEALNRATFKNREKFFREAGVQPGNVVGALLVHSSNVMIVGVRDAGRAFADIDGFVTTDKNVFLSVTVADCLPIFLYDPKREAIGLLHSGWRGLTAGIIASGLRKMVNLGSDPKDIMAAIGPSIGVCHFEVQPDILQRFESYLSLALEKREDKLFLDLQIIATKMLEEAGVTSEHISTSGECTACLSDKYFSYRRDKPPILETMVAVIGMVK
jgi:YfiH family protein